MNNSSEHQSSTHVTTSQSGSEQQQLEGRHKSNDVASSTTPSLPATTTGMSTGSITECTPSLALQTSNSITQQQQQDRRESDFPIVHDRKLSASISSSEDNPQRSSTNPLTITVQPQLPVSVTTATTATLLPTTVATSTISPKPLPLPATTAIGIPVVASTAVVSHQPNNTNLTSLVSFPSNCHHQRHFPTNGGTALLLPKNAATAITGAPTAATISATPLLQQQQQQSNSNTHNASANVRSGNVPLLPTPTPTTAATTSQFIVPTLQQQQQQSAVAIASSSNISISQQQQQQQQLFLQQQHAAAVAAATAAAMAQQHGSSYGGVGYTHLRSGKWLPAEENYALLLVALFERGMITDCVDGTTTLRTYLSQKLHCAPMRISKKFAGRGIGKLTYASKTMASSPNGQQKIPELLDRLRIAEQQFLQAAYPPPVTASLGIIPFPLLQAASQQQQFPMFPTPLMPGMVPNPKLIPPPPQQQMVAATSSTVASESPMAPMITSSSTTVPTQATTELHESYLRALQQADDEASNTNTKPVANTNGTQQQPMATETMPSASSIEIPDLLSGFEKVVQGMKETTPTTNTSSEKEEVASNAVVTSNEYSPPFTSRSFDEFHRFLGKDEISLLDTVASSPPQDEPYINQNTHVTVTALNKDSIQNPIVAIDTNPLFSTESYAMMTQGSSLQASRHGTTYSIPQIQNGGRNNAHDVESILQQIHTHRTHREPPRKSETMSTNSSLYGTGSSSRSNPSSAAFHYEYLNNTNLPMNVTIPNHSSNVGPLSNPPATGLPVTNTNRNHHVTATSQSEDVNIVSGSDPSGGSSSSRSNTSNTSSGTDTTGGTTSNEDDGSEEEGLTSSGAEFDSAEDDDINNNTNGDGGGSGEASNSNKKDHKHELSASRKRAKGSNNNINSNHQQRRGAEGTTATSTTKKKVKFQ